MCYEILVQEKLQVTMPKTETYPHVMRVGWSVDASPFIVGETALSYGYGGTGKASCNNTFSHYGEPYSTNDIITCYIDLDTIPKAIFFAKNGKYLDVAFRLGPEADGKVFYPHISVKNMRFVANFGRFQPYFPPVPGFYLIQHLPAQMLCLPPASPRDRHECEVLMMVGLPSCGKTTWLEKYVKEHPEKKYNILGTNDILVRMKVMGLGRKKNYHGRWDALIKQATEMLNEMLKLAKNKNRNYILDQTNVYPNARRRKMNNFRGYHRIAVVLVNENSVLMQRNDVVVRRDGKIIPESAFMEMKASFTLPVRGEVFDDVWYVEESEARSQHLLKEFNEEGRKWKEEQKKRSIDEVEVKKEPECLDSKKPKYENSTNSNEPRNQYGMLPHHDPASASSSQHNDGTRPSHFNQGEIPNIPRQQSNPGEAFKQENYHQQHRQNAYSRKQQQYNPLFDERKQQNQQSNYMYQQPASNYNPNYRAEAEYPHRNYNETVSPCGGWCEEGFHPVGDHSNPGNNYKQPMNSQRNQSETYSRQGSAHSSTQMSYTNLCTNSSQGYPVKQETCPVAYQNPSEVFHARDQSRGYNSSQNYTAPQVRNPPPQSYDINSQSWGSTQQAGFNNQSQEYWGAGPGWGSAQRPDASQAYGNPQANVAQATQHESWNQNQPYYHGTLPQNYQR